MTDFETRWQNALQTINYMPSGHLNNYRSRVALESAFSKSTFIYGTVGPNSINNPANLGNPVARAAKILATRASTNPSSSLYGRNFNFYDPGSRVLQLTRDGLQMMDMYYGMQNDLFQLRNPHISEFVHRVMEFDKKGVSFDPNMSGRDAFKRAFPNANEGWERNGPETAEYGQSATKEMSKIIREGIMRFGGTLIFEGKDVFGDSMFNPAAAFQGDTDLEAQELFKYFNRPKIPFVKYGKGRLEFHWGGKPATPTRAHFLTNWSYVDRFKTHQPANFKPQGESRWKRFIEKVTGPNHGLRAIWNNFDNYPAENQITAMRAMANTNAHTVAEKTMLAIGVIAIDLRAFKEPKKVGVFDRMTWTGDQRPVGRR